MGHSIDLSKYEMRTDLTIDIIDEKTEGIISKISTKEGIKITNVYVNEKGSKKINKKKGNYITIEFDDITDYDNQKKVEKVLKEELTDLLIKMKLDVNKSCLIIGLGNVKSTPDALGPLTINNILVTNHLFLIGDVEKGFRKVASFSPGVMGQTGLETSDVIKGIVKEYQPDFLIIIDALASQSLERLNKTIQITDTGIHPGSGVYNSRKEISQEILSIPCIAIGIPTVVDAVTIVSDTINYMHKHYTYSKMNKNNPANKLMTYSPNYLKKNIHINKKDKEQLLGIVGTLNDSEIKQLIFEVLSPIGYNMIVTPKEVDFLIEKLSLIISNSINASLHPNIDKN